MLEKIFAKFGIIDRQSFFQLLFQFIKFGLVGLSNSVVSIVCYYIVLSIDEDLYMAGNIIGIIASIFNAFYWNDKFVFTGNKADFKSKLKRLGKTYVSYGATSVLSIILLWVEVNLFSISKEIAPLINIGINIPLNFIINKFWAFKA